MEISATPRVRIRLRNQLAGNDLEGEGGVEGDGQSDGEPEGGAGEEDGAGERERDEGEDAEGRPVVEVMDTCDGVVVRVALENGQVKEFTICGLEIAHAGAFSPPLGGGYPMPLRSA